MSISIANVNPCSLLKVEQDVCMETVIEIKRSPELHQCSTIVSKGIPSDSKPSVYTSSGQSSTHLSVPSSSETLTVRTKGMRSVARTSKEPTTPLNLHFDYSSSLTPPSAVTSAHSAQSSSSLSSLSSHPSVPSTSACISPFAHMSATPPLVLTLERGDQPKPKGKSHKKHARTRGTASKQAEPDYRPLGPRHLEYDYDMAHKQYKQVLYVALGSLGYYGTGKGKLRGVSDSEERAEMMRKVKEIPSVKRAAARLDFADLQLEEALANNQTWENTEVPEEMRWANQDFGEEEWVRQPLLWADAELPKAKKCSRRQSTKNDDDLTDEQRAAKALEEMRLTRSRTGALKPRVSYAEAPTERTSKPKASPSKKRKAEEAVQNGSEDVMEADKSAKPSPDKKRKLDFVDKENDVDVQVEEDQIAARQAKADMKKRRRS